MECVSEHPYQLNEMNDKVVIPFEIKESTDTLFTEMDPDIQFYSSTHYALNTRCDYFIEDTFLIKYHRKKSVYEQIITVSY